MVGIILAGGLSERLSEYGIPKQFVEVVGVPLFMYCLNAFENCNDVDSYVIVAHTDKQEEINRWLCKGDMKKFYAIAPAGKTRHHSITNGLLAVKPLSPERIVIHDAARPLVSTTDISQCYYASMQDGADGATPVLPLTDTVYQSSDGKSITGLLKRDELHKGQTPECYDFNKYLQACEILRDGEPEKVRGCSEVAVSAGMKINIYAGNPLNIKITTNADLEYFKYIAEHGYESMGIKFDWRDRFKGLS